MVGIARADGVGALAEAPGIPAKRFITEMEESLADGTFGIGGVDVLPAVSCEVLGAAEMEMEVEVEVEATGCGGAEGVSFPLLRTKTPSIMSESRSLGS